ncbi:MAG: DUF59 domain-containing protein [Hyphomicrobiales bacterium]|nr:DUF59 domain-containing protein [Hyphomicrobiales bacterium]
MPATPGPDGEFVAYAGSPLPQGNEIAQPSAVTEAIKTVHDPEIPVNVYDLGLIYGLDISADGNVLITMTLTTPGCPVAGQIPNDVAQAVAKVGGVGEVEVRLVWEPTWTKDRMSEDARLALDFF